MRRTFCILHTFMKENQPKMVSRPDNVNLINNFKDWKFKSPPNYTALPIHFSPEYSERIAVNNAIFSKVPTEPLEGNLLLVCSSDDAMTQILDLHPSVTESKEFIEFVAGKYLPEGGKSVCHRYGGHQFGYWADQLGDGRAHILGEYVNSKGESWQPQLKGSGETPFSRFADGRAVLRSSLREMIASEACWALGMPTTRAAALVVSTEHRVYRDAQYMGRPRAEPVAVVLRLAPAWYRLGSFEILARRHEPELERKLLDFVIQTHFPEIDVADVDKAVKFFSEVAHRNLDLVAAWQGFGFTHGVLNTDNVSVLGLTLDYGPYGFLDHTSQHHVPNTSDDLGMYAYNRQAKTMLWNLGKFAEALRPILSEDQIAKVDAITATLEEYVEKKILETFLLKLGLSVAESGDSGLVAALLDLMEDAGADFTMTFRQLAEVDPRDLSDKSVLEQKWSLLKASAAGDAWTRWTQQYMDRLTRGNVKEEERRSRMLKANPLYVPRNWMLQEAIKDAEKFDFEKVRFLQKLLRKPYEVDEEADRRGYSSPPPNWAYGLRLSCSS